MLSTTRDLFRHMAWADAKMWHSVLATSTAENDAALRQKVCHIHSVQRGYLAIWRGGAPEWRDASTFTDLHSLAVYGREYHDDVAGFLATLDEPSLDQTAPLPWAGRLTEVIGVQPADTTLRDTLLQVATHSLYHRGQVNARLRELGSEPPLVDYIAWIWIGRPTPEWPSFRG